MEEEDGQDSHVTPQNCNTTKPPHAWMCEPCGSHRSRVPYIYTESACTAIQTVHARATHTPCLHGHTRTISPPEADWPTSETTSRPSLRWAHSVATVICGQTLGTCHHRCPDAKPTSYPEVTTGWRISKLQCCKHCHCHYQSWSSPWDTH